MPVRRPPATSRVPAGVGPARLAVRGRRAGGREAAGPPAPPEHRPRQLPPASRATAAGPAISRPSVHFRSHDAPVDAVHPAPYRFSAGRPLRDRRRRHLPPLRLPATAPDAAFTLDAAATPKLLTSLRRAAATSHGRPLEPRLLPGRARRPAPRSPWSPRPNRGRRSGARPAEGAAGAERTRRRAG